jgi:two-component sensor histidine kinase
MATTIATNENALANQTADQSALDSVSSSQSRSNSFHQAYHELAHDHVGATDVLVQLRSNLAQLEDLHARLKFMMGELSYLLKRD